MNSKVKEQWLKALRSGEYKQGNGCLKSGDEFCCLGVLTDIYAKENNLQWKGGFSADAKTETDKVIYGKEAIPRAFVCEWAGLSEPNPKIKPIEKNGLDSLAGINDEGYTFEQIADIIEQQL